MSEGIYDDVPEEPTSGHQRRRRGWRPWRRPAELITSAQRSPAENRRSRERVYFFLQAIRIPILVLSGLALFWLENWPIAILLFAISIPLPAIAVVIANEKGEKRDPRQPNVYKPALLREQAEQERLTRTRQAELEARRAGETRGEEPETINSEDFPDRSDRPGGNPGHTP